MYIECSWFSADKIHESGQCFRWEKESDDTYIIPAYGSRLYLQKEQGNMLRLSCSEQEYRDIWEDYFDMEFDYKAHAETACSLIGSDYLTESVKASEGIRILRQDLWETVVSFIVSANNNIPRIRKTLFNLCAGKGSFPSPEEFLDMGIENIRKYGTGFRDKYIINAAEFFHERNVKSEMKGMDYEQARDYLMQIKGVGVKVADCICLFALGFKDAFPRDVHIKRIEAEHFAGRFPEELSCGCAGVLQQYMFYYNRMA